MIDAASLLRDGPELVGLYHPLFLAIKLYDPISPEDLAQQRDRAFREFSDYLQVRHAEYRSHNRDLPELSPNVALSVVRSKEAIAARTDLHADTRDRLMADSVRWLMNWLVEDRRLRELRRRCLDITNVSDTPLHEWSHLALSCSSSVQGYWNWLFWIQATYVRRYLRDTTAAGESPRAPLLQSLGSAIESGNVLAMFLVEWCALEEFLDVLSGERLDRWPPSSGARGVFLAKRAEEQFRFLAQDALNENIMVGSWGGSDCDVCPKDLEDLPYGLTAIQEGFAVVTANTASALSYFDLLDNRPNERFHDIYLRLPALAASRLRTIHPDIFRYTFIAVCDIAMSSHIHPACVDLRREQANDWQDLHPGWRFHRALEVIANDPSLLVVELERDYQRVITETCHRLGWPTPRSVADSVNRLNQKASQERALSPMIKREKALAEIRSTRPWFLCAVHELLDAIKPVAMSRESGQWGILDGDEYRHALAHWYTIDFTRKAMLASKYSMPAPFDKKIPSFQQLQVAVHSQTGCTVGSLWPDS